MSKHDLFGLVLIGGKSSRMGADKSLISYHDVTQRDHAFHLLEKHCEKVFLSCNPAQKTDINLPYIEDQLCEGPLTGIIAAHEAFPDVSWLVIACDMPYLDDQLLNQLISMRVTHKAATCFKKSLIEPLCAIWENSCFSDLTAYYKSGQKSPKTFLDTRDVKVIELSDDEGEKLRNINSSN